MTVLDRDTAVGATILLALLNLPDRNRYAIVQRVWHDRTYNEIGDTLGVTGSRAEQLVKHGLDLLRADLAPYRDQLAA